MPGSCPTQDGCCPGHSRERITVFQIGSRRHYAVPRGLAAAGVFESLVTDVYADVLPWRLAKFLPRCLRNVPVQRLLGRRAAELDPQRVTAMPWFALRQAVRRRQGGKRTPRADVWARINREFCAGGRRRLAPHATAVYAFNGAALELFREAARQGMRCILDQTSAPWRYNRELLAAEAERWPGWEENPLNLDVSGEMIAREEAEWELADGIICGSGFVVEAIRQVGGPTAKCRVVAYPTPTVDATMRVVQPGKAAGVTKVLYVGRLELGKGIQYFWEAAGVLDRAKYRLRAVGGSNLTAFAQKQVTERIEWVGPVARSEVGKQYAWADVVVLPTLSEGSANVCHEALACRRPVITTEAAGAPADHPGLWIVPTKNATALADRIAEAARGPVVPVQELPCRTIAEYGRELAEAIGQVASSP